MKCEICKKNEAETAIAGPGGSGDDELYVCRECERREKVRRQKNSQRTRKSGGKGGATISITRIDGGNVDTPPPHALAALADAVSGFVRDIEAAIGGKENNGKGGDEDGESHDTRQDAPAAPGEPAEMHRYEPRGVPRKYTMQKGLHLEGLFIIGEIEAAKRAFDAMEMTLSGASPDGISDAGHVFWVDVREGDEEKAERAVAELVRQEQNARSRLDGEFKRVFADSLCRSLAILKNCRLLSSGELFDLLSPMRLAAQKDFLDGITLREIENSMKKIDLEGDDPDGTFEPSQRDELDGSQADAVNRMFADVVLNDNAGEILP